MCRGGRRLPHQLPDLTVRVGKRTPVGQGGLASGQSEPGAEEEAGAVLPFEIARGLRPHALWAQVASFPPAGYCVDTHCQRNAALIP